MTDNIILSLKIIEKFFFQRPNSLHDNYLKEKKIYFLLNN